MSESVKISVVVPTYNREDYLAAAVRSVVEQSRAPHEVVVVDDGSNFDVAAYLERHGLTQCEVLTLDNGGKPRAVNTALARLTGTHVWVFDDDDLADDKFLEVAANALEQTGADYAYGWHHAGRSDRADEIPITESRRPAFEGSGLTEFQTLLWGCSIAHNATIVSLEACRTLGGLDESFPCSEDYEFQLRLAAKFRGVFVDAPAFTRRMHAGVRGSNAFAYAERDRRRRFLEHDRRFICEWLERVPLCELPAPPSLHTPDEGQPPTLGDSLLFAFAVAARVGAWHVALGFLSSWCREQDEAASERVSQRRFVAGIFRWSDREVLEGLTDALKTAKSDEVRGSLSLIMPSIRRGLAQRALRVLKSGQFQDALHTFFMALRA